MYEINSIQFAIISDQNLVGKKSFMELWNNYIQSEFKLLGGISMNMSVNVPTVGIHFVVFMVDLDSLPLLEGTPLLNGMINASNQPNTKVLIVINKCDNLKLNDGVLCVAKKYVDKYSSTLTLLEKSLRSESYQVFLLSTLHAMLYNKLINSTASNMISVLSADEIELLGQMYCPVKVFSKMTSDQKKKEIKKILKDSDFEEDLIQTGYIAIRDYLKNNLKAAGQRRIIYDNFIGRIQCVELYLHATSIEQMGAIRDDIDRSTYLKELLPALKIQCENMFATKLEVLLTNSLNTNAEHIFVYRKQLFDYQSKLFDLKMDKLEVIVQNALKMVSDRIICMCEKDLDIVDLNKLQSILELLEHSNKESITGLYAKIITNQKLFQENLLNGTGWIEFITFSKRINVPDHLLIQLIETIVMKKIDLCCSPEKSNRSDAEIIYPYCLLNFLQMNLNASFLYQKLHMYLFYHIKYSHRQLIEKLKDVTEEQYRSCMSLEFHLRKFVGKHNYANDHLSLSSQLEVPVNEYIERYDNGKGANVRINSVLTK
jgi:hypothetical protein